MKIQVQIYLPDQNQGTVWGYGTITLDQLLTFQIRILTCEKGAGIKEAFVSFPRRKQGERWEDLVIVEDSLRNQITEAVREAIQMEITKDLYLPPIEVVHLQVFPKGKKIPAVVEYLGKVLTPAVIGMLVVYCLKDTAIAASPHGVPEAAAVLTVAVLHIWKRNNLLSIGVGTVLYMFLIQVVF